MWSTARSEAALEAQLPLPIAVRKIRTARRMRLRIDESRARLTLTCPWRTSRRTALAWAVEQRAWIDAQISRIGEHVPFGDGSSIPLEGQIHVIDWDASRSRTIVVSEGRLVCGGPPEGLERRIESYLKRRALAVMSEDVAEFGETAGVVARGVSIGDAASRWGSCSSTGRIRLSWRLIMAPPHVRRYVVAHEVAHLRHLNHGPDFKSLERALVGPGLAAAKRDLKTLGPDLRRLGRRSL